MTRSIRLGAQRTIRPLADLDDVPPSFVKWLRERGAEILGTTNPWEVLRFRAKGRTSVVYRRGHGRISACTGDVEEAWRAYQAGTTWSAGSARSRLNRPKTRQRIAAVIKRDGRACFYCGLDVEEGEETLEHIVPRAHGGPHHVANLALAHEPCNQEAGNLSAVEKVRLRDRMRGREG